jgi:hypothetical protein
LPAESWHLCCTARRRRVDRRLQRLATFVDAERTTIRAVTNPWRPTLKSSTATLTAMATSLVLATAAHAQTAAPAAKPTAKPTAKAATKAAAKPAAKAAARTPAPAEVPLATAEGEQLAAAAMTHFGDYACEFNQTVNVTTTPKYDGYVDVRFKAQTWTMKPVLSSTGALRLEDVKGRMLMLQIANKSMLLDTKVGQRVVDECVHEKQRAQKVVADASAVAAPK